MANKQLGAISYHVCSSFLTLHAAVCWFMMLLEHAKLFIPWLIWWENHIP